jgi:hypothetical protein
MPPSPLASFVLGLAAVLSPVFYHNYPQQAWAANRAYMVRSVPRYPNNRPGACVRVVRADGTELYSFFNAQAAGDVFWVSADGQHVLALPVGIGTGNLVPYIAPADSAQPRWVRHFRAGALVDSVYISPVYLTVRNKAYICGRRRFRRFVDLHRIISTRLDSVALITNHENVVLTLVQGRLVRRELPGFGFVRRFRPYAFSFDYGDAPCQPAVP